MDGRIRLAACLLISLVAALAAAQAQPSAPAPAAEKKFVLAGPGVKTAILSNAWDWMPTRHGQYINDSVFDYIAYSQEIGLAKPTPASFQHVLDKLGVTAPEAIFVDDFPENIAAANALGLHGILFRPQDDVREAITARLG